MLRVSRWLINRKFEGHRREKKSRVCDELIVAVAFKPRFGANMSVVASATVDDSEIRWSTAKGKK